jgi:hypothetical protein
MAMGQDTLQKIVQAIQAGDFKTATIDITDIMNEDDELYEAVLGCLVNLFSRGDVDEKKISGTVTQITAIYDQNKGDPSQLEEKLNLLLSKAGVMQGKIHVDQELGDLSSWTDKQLADRLNKLKKEQQTLLSSGNILDPKAGEHLNQLLAEQSKRLGFKGKNISTDDESGKEEGSGERPEGADSWFVTPTEEELNSTITTRVVCGSPIITILRERYKQEYKIKKILDVNPNAMGNLSGDEAYEIKRELSKQRDFVNNYSDPALVLDQDMCAYSIASEFLTDKYAKPSLVRIDDELSCHLFKSGALKDFFSNNSKLHDFSMEGSVVGRFAICLNRKEPTSGRFISDAYDILEFQDGRPYLYFCSTKGVSSLSRSVMKEIKLTLKNISCDLHIPDPAVARETVSEEEIERFIQEHKNAEAASKTEAEEVEPEEVLIPDQEVANVTEVEAVAEAELANEEIELDENTDEALKPDDTEEEVNTYSEVPEVSEAPEVLEVPEVSETEEPTEVPEVSETEEPTEVPEVSETAEAPEVTESVEAEGIEVVSAKPTETIEKATEDEDMGEEVVETAMEEPSEEADELEENESEWDESKIDEGEEEPVQPEEESTAVPEAKEEVETDDVEARMKRLEKIVLNSADTLDKMERQIAKVSEFITARKQDEETKNEVPIEEDKDEERLMLKRRAEAIKEAIRKKKEAASAAEVLEATDEPEEDTQAKESSEDAEGKGEE